MHVKTNNQGAEATKCRCAGGGRGRTRKWRRSREEDGPASTQAATQGRPPFLPHKVTLHRREMVDHPEGALGFQLTDRALTQATDS